MIMSHRISPSLVSLCFVSLGLVRHGGKCGSRRPAAQQSKKTRNPPEIVEDAIVTPRAVCRWAEKPPVLDGKLDDRCWQKAAVIDHFASFWTKTPRAGTFAYLVWDHDALYYACLDDRRRAPLVRHQT